MISTRSAGLLIDTVVCLTLAKWETVSGRFGGYLTRLRITGLVPWSSSSSRIGAVVGLVAEHALNRDDIVQRTRCSLGHGGSFSLTWLRLPTSSSARFGAASPTYLNVRKTLYVIPIARRRKR